VSVTEDDDDEDSGRLWQTLVGTALVVAIAVVVLGFFGNLHPLGDSLAVFRAYAVGLVLVLAIAASVLGLQVAAFWAILFAMCAGAPVLLAQVWPGPTGQVVLYQKNLRYDNYDLPGLEADIRASGAVAVTLQEVSQPNLALVAALKDRLPHQHLCPGSGIGGPAILTNLTPVPGTTICAEGLAAMQVMWRGTQEELPVWLVSVHLHWPWPYRQATQVDTLAPILAGLDGPVLMAGDFNMVRWGASVKRLAAAAETRPAGPTPGTFVGLSTLPSLPIDLAFATSGGRITLRPALGSDHMGLLTYLEP
jgi:endonuclease/exonuclease/phosphatase (EEP) superfamily protein YafD